MPDNLEHGGNLETEQFWQPQEVAITRQPSSLAVLVAGAYFLVMPALTTVLLISALQAPDRRSAEEAVRLVLFPFGDVILVASGLARAFAGYFVNEELAIVASSVPILLATLVPVAIQSGLLLFVWWGVSRLLHQRRQAPGKDRAWFDKSARDESQTMARDARSNSLDRSV